MQLWPESSYLHTYRLTEKRRDCLTRILNGMGKNAIEKKTAMAFVVGQYYAYKSEIQINTLNGT